MSDSVDISKSVNKLIAMELDPLDLAPFIAARMAITYTHHSKKMIDERKIPNHTIQFLVKEFVFAFSKMVDKGLIDYFSYKFLVVHDKYRLVIRFHFFLENDDLKFIVKIITVMYNYNTKINIKHNVIDVSKGILLHGKKEIHIGKSNNGREEKRASSI